MAKNVKIKNFIRKFFEITLPLLSIFFLIGVTAIVILIAKGYSINFAKRELSLTETGVLNVETTPNRAQVYINGEYADDTDKAFTSLATGLYQVDISKEGYHNYTTKVKVEHGKAVFVNTHLILNPISSLQTQKLSQTFKKQTLISTLEPQENGPILYITTNAKKNTIYIHRFDISKPLLDEASVDTTLVATITNSPKTALELERAISSKDNSSLILQIYDKAVIIATRKRNLKIDLSKSKSLLVENYLSNPKTSIVWTDHSDYILIKSGHSLISFNINNKRKTLLYDLSEKEINLYVTNGQNLYILRPRRTPKYETQTPTEEEATEGSPINQTNYAISTISLAGGEMATVYAEIPLSEEEKPLNLYSYSVGKIPLFILTTDTSSYLIGDIYTKNNGEMIDEETKKLLENYPIEKYLQQDENDFYEIIKFKNQTVTNPKFLTEYNFFSYQYTNSDDQNNVLEKFVYNKEAADISTSLGPTILLTSDKTYTLTTIRWLMNANYILVSDNENLTLVDYKGENKYQISEEEPNHLGVVSRTGDKYLMYEHTQEVKENKSETSSEDNLDNNSEPATTTVKQVKLIKLY